MSGGAGVAGVYGKVPAQADFLRANAGQFSRVGLDQWFQSGVEVLHKEGTALPAPPTAFLLVPEAPSGAFIGAFAPSTDAVGRAFPLIVFAEVAVSREVEHLAALPRLHASFFAAAGALAEAGVNLTGSELAARAQELTLDAGGPGASATDWATASAAALVATLGGAPAAAAYALRTFALACEQAAKLDPSGPPNLIVVDAPAPTRATAELWLELARKKLPPAGKRLSALWTDGPSGRLLLGLGGPPPAILGYLANPRHRASRFWPLRTEVGSALEQAERALSAGQRQCLGDPATTLGELCASFTREA